MKQKKSLIHSAAPKIQDIRTFFNPSRDYEASKLPFYPAVQLPIIDSNPNLGEVREGESGLGNWDPGL